MTPKVYICIPVHNRFNYTIACLKSIFLQTYENFHVVISDAGSTDGTKEIIEKNYPEKVTVLSIDSSNFWTGGINACIRYVLSIANEYDFIYTLNNDTVILPETIGNLITSVNSVGSNCIIGSVNLFYSEPNRIEPSAFIYRKGLLKGLLVRKNYFGENISNYIGLHEVDSLSGKGVLFPVIVYKDIGLYNDKMLPHYHADNELVVRAKKNGFKVFISYTSRLHSHVEISGLGTNTSEPQIKSFIKSFFSIKSANHYKSRYNYYKLINKHKAILLFTITILFTIGGFFKRFFLNIINFK